MLFLRRFKRLSTDFWDHVGNLLQNQELKLIHIFSALSCFKIDSETEVQSWDLASRIMTINVDIKSWGFRSHLKQNSQKYKNLIRYIQFSNKHLMYLSGVKNDTVADRVSPYDPIVKELIHLMNEALKDLPSHIKDDVKQVSDSMKCNLTQAGYLK